MVTANSTPPSPPLSESSATAKTGPATPLPIRKPSIALSNAKRPPISRSPSTAKTSTPAKAPTSLKTPASTKTPDSAKTLKPNTFPYRKDPPRHSRGPSYTMSSKPSTVGRVPPAIRTAAPASKGPRPSAGGKPTSEGPPRSSSLYQIRGLIGKMQKLEERVHSARSKLPAPQGTPPRGSPRNGSAMSGTIPNSVTLRSARKRASGSTTSSITAPREPGVSRMSFGVSTSEAPSSSRPNSRASMSSQSGVQRPGSRSSARTPMGHYSTPSISGVEGRVPRPQSSMSGSSAGYSHAHSRSISSSVPPRSDDSDASNVMTPIARRMSINKTGIPTPSALPMARRQSGTRRASQTSQGTEGDMGPPARPRKMSEIGETYIGETF